MCDKRDTPIKGDQTPRFKTCSCILHMLRACLIKHCMVPTRMPMSMNCTRHVSKLVAVRRTHTLESDTFEPAPPVTRPEQVTPAGGQAHRRSTTGPCCRQQKSQVALICETVEETWVEPVPSTLAGTLQPHVQFWPHRISQELHLPVSVGQLAIHADSATDQIMVGIGFLFCEQASTGLAQMNGSIDLPLQRCNEDPGVI